MTVAREHARAKIERAQARLVQLQAREALAEMRRKTQARSKARRQHARHRFELGEVVEEAGLGSWSKAELTGLLMRARDQFGDSDLTRKMLQAHASESQGIVGSNRIH